MKVGSLVELVEDFKNPPKHMITRPIKNVIYTVREFDEDDPNYLRLEEIINPKFYYSEGYSECCFPVAYFRELQPPMDISELIEESIYQTV